VVINENISLGSWRKAAALVAVEFEIRERDLLARIGRLKTKSGTVETPAFLPVINPSRLAVTPREMFTDFGCRILITNAHIIKKNFGEAFEKGVHSFLDFPGVVMTDSGAYQILAYGRVEVTPDEIIKCQEKLNTDIATILDLPTGWRVSKEHARFTVDETVKRAKELFTLRSRVEIGWVGPVQGGRYLDLVAESAKEMAKLPFDIYALGSPTPVMEQYLFSLLVDMILTAKINLPINIPFHLFGAGHPFMFALAVALGCDLFDSAAYSLFANEGRYLTDHGTVRLERLEYFPCACPVCVKREPKELAEMPQEERERDLTKHNLYVCFSEMKQIKQAIAEGRLWEHLEVRAHGHPSLLQALKNLKRYSDYIERHSPATKKSGLFFFSSVGLARPEVVRYGKRLLERYTPREGAELLLLIPKLESKRSRRNKRYRKILKTACERLSVNLDTVQVCIYAPPFGVIPEELKEVYPVGQCECAYPPDYETIKYIAQRVVIFAQAMGYGRSVMLATPGTWQEKTAKICKRICSKKGIKFEFLLI
jgi:7-cyano-7-deazaguanine tRNA-ribosyltransferase